MPQPDVLSPPLLDSAISAAALVQWVLAYVRRHSLVNSGERVLVAVSGGPDSVALLHLLWRLKPELGLELGVAHFDHGLRGRESQADARFVADLAKRLALPFYLGTGEVRDLARTHKISLQMAARQLRLNFLKDTCRRQAYQKLALGHTADDQVELFFLRLLRGAGPEGLKGMWPATPEGLVRPLLAVGKAVLLAWLGKESLPYRQDSSNLSRGSLRNRLRLDLLPELRRHYNPRLTEAIWRTQALLQEDERLLAAQTDQAWAAVGQTRAADFYSLDLPRFFSLDPALQKRLLRATLGKLLTDQEITSAQVVGLLALGRAEKSGGRLTLGQAQVARAGGELHLFRPLPPPPAASATLLPTPPGQVDSPEGWRWQLSSRAPEAAGPWPPPPQAACLDQERVTFPLKVRYFQPADRFWPQGAPGPKKLQDFLINCKIPRWLRPHLPLVESAGHIVWVPGLRVAEPVKLTSLTRRILEVKVSPQNAATRRVWKMLLSLKER